MINDFYIPAINDFHNYEINEKNIIKENYLAELNNSSPYYKSFLTFTYCYYNSNSFLQCFNDIFIEYFPNENDFETITKKDEQIDYLYNFLKVLLRKYKIMI